MREAEDTSRGREYTDRFLNNLNADEKADIMHLHEVDLEKRIVEYVSRLVQEVKNPNTYCGTPKLSDTANLNYYFSRYRDLNGEESIFYLIATTVAATENYLKKQEQKNAK